MTSRDHSRARQVLRGPQAQTSQIVSHFSWLSRASLCRFNLATSAGETRERSLSAHSGSLLLVQASENESLNSFSTLNEFETFRFRGLMLLPTSRLFCMFTVRHLLS